jgi:hypothetical protein
MHMHRVWQAVRAHDMRARTTGAVMRPFAARVSLLFEEREPLEGASECLP